MEWLTALALLPALACGVIMGGMALGVVFGLRRSHTATGMRPTAASSEGWSADPTKRTEPEGATR